VVVWWVLVGVLMVLMWGVVMGGVEFFCGIVFGGWLVCDVFVVVWGGGVVVGF